MQLVNVQKFIFLVIGADELVVCKRKILLFEKLISKFIYLCSFDLQSIELYENCHAKIYQFRILVVKHDFKKTLRFINISFLAF